MKFLVEGDDDRLSVPNEGVIEKIRGNKISKSEAHVALITSPKNFVNFLETKNRTNETIHFYFYLFSFSFSFFFDFSLFLWNRSFPKWPL